MKLTENQINFLLEFFKDERHLGWKNIAINLIKNGKCIVAGTDCIWKEGIGNFINTEFAKNAVDCLEYTFDLEYFLSSEWFKEVSNNKIRELFIKKREIEQEYEDICNL